ncbi:RNA polymerase sigma-70 factor, ECF subfamily [Nonomuraea solani]|uniref:RNA polymerase sigma-70 factor, ECF subfamily n=1 Tax=Nonomuraea solani TaxID=1144553 RepID=A0A1H5Y759_9ACTN|nr:RNA polymerase sigma factor [Nonomuraea solani]SEG19507.1 RNA polymerase sigma-70 factor, ECF subfamily [Nonomuraea solani]
MDDERLARFEAVYRETYGQITAYAVRRCDSPQDAADVVAETFTIAWRRMDDLPSGEEATLWLYGVARNVLANHHRSEGRRKARSAELDVRMADRYADSPESRLEREAITQIFRTLTDDDRELLALVAWEGLDPKGIATALGLSRNVVRVRLHRARRRFSRALTEAGICSTPESRLAPAERSL